MEWKPVFYLGCHFWVGKSVKGTPMHNPEDLDLDLL